jgi:AraC-like DNA-binding protein
LSLTIVETILYAVVSCALPMLIVKEDCDKIKGYVKDAVAKINDGSFIKKSPKDVYALYPLSHTTFIKSFKDFTDKTPSEYLTDKKLEYAKNLLLTTNDSVLDVSLIVGFDSVSHFIKIFKAKYGITPLQLRKTDVNNKDPELVK